MCDKKKGLEKLHVDKNGSVFSPAWKGLTMKWLVARDFCVYVKYSWILQ